MATPHERRLPFFVGPVAWGLFIILCPISLLILGTIIWIPILLWRTGKSIQRYGGLRGGVLRFAIIAGIVTLAILAPLKLADQRVGPFPGTQITFSQLTDAHIAFPSTDEAFAATTLQLPSIRPTRREIIQAINDQTPFRAHTIGCCDTFYTVLTGPAPVPILIRPEHRAPNPPSPPAIPPKESHPPAAQPAA